MNSTQPEQNLNSMDQFTINGEKDILSFCAICSRTFDAIISLIEQETTHLQNLEIVNADCLQEEKKDLITILYQQIDFFTKHGRVIYIFAPNAVRNLSRQHKILRQSVNASMKAFQSLHSEFLTSRPADSVYNRA